MKSKEFLIEKFNHITEKFPNIHLSYEYDPGCEMHIVEVIPTDIYDFNESYKSIEADICIEFDNSFFPESLVFVSPESIDTVENPEYTFSGHLYHLTVSSFEPIKVNPPPIPEYAGAGENNFALAA